jgi:hypothetical protein
VFDFRCRDEGGEPRDIGQYQSAIFRVALHARSTPASAPRERAIGGTHPCSGFAIVEFPHYHCGRGDRRAGFPTGTEGGEDMAKGKNMQKEKKKPKQKKK